MKPIVEEDVELDPRNLDSQYQFVRISSSNRSKRYHWIARYHEGEGDSCHRGSRCSRLTTSLRFRRRHLRQPNILCFSSTRQL
ncbi:unnamed protein product [Linum trigynum]|uniref:Uncharacterized protein n=1 Tax=Linum trigynum TaxID=586398 RepID=A0AAV2ET68_9ROSI